MIPPFRECEGYPTELLPEGIYPADETELSRALVDAFPASRTRRNIAEGFFRLRADAANMGIGGAQWVDGSFVEAKVDPNDVDVVNIVDAELLNALPPGAQLFAERFLGPGKAAWKTYSADCFLVVRVEAGDPRYDAHVRAVAVWRRDWGRTTPVEDARGVIVSHPKGFVEMTFGLEIASGGTKS